MKKILFFLCQLCAMTRAYWRVENHEIFYDTKPVRFKGINWYGLETSTRCILGLDHHSIDYYLDELASRNFNAIRLPVSLQMILYDHRWVDSAYVTQEPRAQNKTTLEITDLLVYSAQTRGIMILMDIHRLQYGISQPLWYIPGNLNYTEDRLIEGINALVERYKFYSNFLGVDIYNEPHYDANYGSGSPTLDWRLFIEKSVESVMTYHHDAEFLLFVGGMDWGKNMSQFGHYPPNLPAEFAYRVVYSPHLYGPTLNYFSSLDKSNLYFLWDSLFGYMITSQNFHIFVGEWGGRFQNEKDRKWLDAFSDYLIERGITNQFFWALNPNSKDVQGLLKNWDEWDEEIQDFLDRIQPKPTVIFDIL